METKKTLEYPHFKAGQTDTTTTAAILRFDQVRTTACRKRMSKVQPRVGTLVILASPVIRS
ncbi:hypothetical protein YC2023_019842 [Brassica napus]